MSLQLPSASDEQQAIVDSVSAGYHVLVDAVAGAGKTTTILHIATALQRFGARVFVFTYNAKLKSETRVKCKRMGITNVEVNTYHSAAVRLYGDPLCATDEGITKLLQRPFTPLSDKYANSQFSLVVIDEAQDMIPLYLSLVRKIIRDVCPQDVQFAVLGDTRQAIYGFKGADARFLSMAPQLSNYAPLCRPWRSHPLSTSYRLPPRITHFVNSQLLDGKQVLSSALSQPLGCVRYLRCNPFSEDPFLQIKAWLDSGLQLSDIFILAPSIRRSTSKNMSPLCKLENRLAAANMFCCVASSDDDRLDEDVTRGKIVIATFHQVKGLERTAVLLFNFDDSYHQITERGVPGVGCPNPIYVAATRAMLNLTVLHNSSNAHMRMVRMGSLSQDCEYIGSHLKARAGTAGPNVASSTKAVTDVLRHLPQDVLLAAFKCLSITPLSNSQPHVHQQTQGGDVKIASTLLKSKVQTEEERWENVAAITGTAMPCMFEHRTRGKCTLLSRVAETERQTPVPFLPDLHSQRIMQLDACQDTTSLSTAEFLFIANVHIAQTEGYTNKLSQIKVYDWLAESDVSAMMEVMKHHVQSPPASIRYEVPADTEIALPVAERKIKLCGAIDCLDLSTNTAFEIKCVSELSAEHFLQTALNGLLLERRPRSDQSQALSASQSTCGYKHVLLNLCDGAAFEVNLGIRAEGAMRAAVILLEAKYVADKAVDDATFLASTMIGRNFGKY